MKKYLLLICLVLIGCEQSQEERNIQKARTEYFNKINEKSIQACIDKGGIQFYQLGIID